MKNIYIVIKLYEYESGNILSLFDNKSKALKFAKQYTTEIGTGVEVLEIDSRELKYGVEYPYKNIIFKCLNKRVE